MDTRQTTSGKHMLGEILLQRGLIKQEHLEQALRIQVGGLRRLGHILVKMKCLSDENLTDALAEQLQLPIVTIAEVFRKEAQMILPRFLCRKYSVLPLALEKNNVLKLAMADPLDRAAITDVENYTGFAVDPTLARLSDISRSIPRLVPLSSADFFNPHTYRAIARVTVFATLVLLAVTGMLVYRQVIRQRYGTIEFRDGAVSYKNLDLIIDYNTRDSTVYLNGRGAYAPGYYGVKFENAGALSSFVKSQTRQFSSQQLEWIDWVLAEKLKPQPSPGGPKRG